MEFGLRLFSQKCVLPQYQTIEFNSLYLYRFFFYIAEFEVGKLLFFNQCRNILTIIITEIASIIFVNMPKCPFCFFLNSRAMIWSRRLPSITKNYWPSPLLRGATRANVIYLKCAHPKKQIDVFERCYIFRSKFLYEFYSISMQYCCSLFQSYLHSR